MNINTETNMASITRSNIQDSRTLATTEIGDTSLLDNTPISETFVSSGTALAMQNNLQISDASRNKDKYDSVEIDWDFKKTTSKPFVQDTFAWTTAAGVNTTLITYRFPNDYFTANHVLQNVGQTFLSMRGDLHFILTVQSTPLVSGALIIAPDYIREGPINLNSLFLRQHAILDASDNNSTVDLIVPFKYVRNAIDPFGNSCDIHVVVLTPLGGTPTVNCTVTCFLENQEFKFLRPQGTEALRSTQGLLNFTTINQTLSNVENATLPVNMTGDKLDLTGKLMDDVGISTNPTAVVVKFNSLNNADNPHYIEKMSLSPSTLRLSNEDTFNSKLDEMSMKHIMQEREHYFKSFTVGTTTSVASQITTFPVCPTPTAATTLLPLTREVNVMEQLADNMKFWRGGLKYRIRFHMNRFQSIKIYVGLFYKSLTPLAFVDWSSSHGVIVDIGGDQRELIVEVPYNAETPWLHVPKKYMDPDFHGKRYFHAFDYILGQLAIYALTPLISPTGSPTIINAHISMMGSDDFELANYSPSHRAQSETILLSKKSERTPNFMNDVVTNLKQILCKYQTVSINPKHPVENKISALLYRPYSALLPPQPGAVQTSGFGDVTLHSISTKQLEYGGMYSAYNGGFKVRIKMALNPGSRETPERILRRSNWTPFCYYINDDAYEINTDLQFDSAGLLRIADQLEGYCRGTAISQKTPYVAQMVNVTDSEAIYEVEIPYQRNLKYSMVGQTDDSCQFGYILFGFQYIGDDFTAEDKGQLQYTVKIKMADDARFGILERAIGKISPGTRSWLI